MVCNIYFCWWNSGFHQWSIISCKCGLCLSILGRFQSSDTRKTDGMVFLYSSPRENFVCHLSDSNNTQNKEGIWYLSEHFMYYVFTLITKAYFIYLLIYLFFLWLRFKKCYCFNPIDCAPGLIDFTSFYIYTLSESKM